MGSCGWEWPPRTCRHNTDRRTTSQKTIIYTTPKHHPDWRHTLTLLDFTCEPGGTSGEQDGDRTEIWDAEDFDPCEALERATVRVLRYRRYKPNGEVIQAEWLTCFRQRQLGSWGLYRMAKSRCEIENQVFNDGKNRYGMEHIRHHEPNSMLVNWPLIRPALVTERLYRLRYLPALLYAVTATLRPFPADKDRSACEVDKMHPAWIKSVLPRCILWSWPYVRPGEF